MLRIAKGLNIYLALGPTDLRSNIDRLSLIVEKQFKLDLFSDSIFLFCNRRQDKLKILFWDRNGFWLYYKRLEKDIFLWPSSQDGNRTLSITERSYVWVTASAQYNKDRRIAIYNYRKGRSTDDAIEAPLMKK